MDYVHLLYFKRYPYGEEYVYFLKAFEKWLCDENPRYDAIAETCLSVYLRSLFPSSTFSFMISSVKAIPVSFLNFIARYVLERNIALDRAWSEFF